MRRVVLWCVLLAAGLVLLPTETWSAETAVKPPPGVEKAGNEAKPAEVARSEPVKPQPKKAAAIEHRTGEAAIESALGAPAQMEFVETPLQDVVEFLKDHHQIEIQIDRKALNEAGTGIDTPVNFRVRNLPLMSALNLMLREVGLTWTLHDGVLLITTPEQAESQLIVKVYDVADLVVCRDSKDKLWDDYDPLVDAITATVAPVSWDTVGGPGSIDGASLGTAKVLVVSQTYQIHREIAELLEKVRAVASKKSGGADLPRRDPSPSEPAKTPAVVSGVSYGTPPGVIPYQPISPPAKPADAAPAPPSRGDGVF